MAETSPQLFEYVLAIMTDSVDSTLN